MDHGAEQIHLDRCKFEHPGANSNNMSNNRFAVLQGSYTDRRNSKYSRKKVGRQSTDLADNPAGPPFPGLDKETLIKDLSTERPQWTLSAFGPGRNGPEQLFGGLLRELSFEEMRLKHYVSSNPQHTVNHLPTSSHPHHYLSIQELALPTIPTNV